MDLTWVEFKNKVDSNNLIIQERKRGASYFLEAYNNQEHIKCKIDSEDADGIDYETNYQSLSNGKVKNSVRDAYQSEDLVPKFACGEANFVNDVATIKIKCPGALGDTDRYLIDGYCFTDLFHFGDKITKVQVTDEDNLLGYGAGFVLKTYHDSALPLANQGWYLWEEPGNTGGCDLDNAGGTASFPSSMFLYVEVTKKSTSSATTAMVNVFWCEKEI